MEVWNPFPGLVHTLARYACMRSPCVHAALLNPTLFPKILPASPSSSAFNLFGGESTVLARSRLERPHCHQHGHAGFVGGPGLGGKTATTRNCDGRRKAEDPGQSDSGLKRRRCDLSSIDSTKISRPCIDAQVEDYYKGVHQRTCARSASQHQALRQFLPNPPGKAIPLLGLT